MPQFYLLALIEQRQGADADWDKGDNRHAQLAAMRALRRHQRQGGQHHRQEVAGQDQGGVPQARAAARPGGPAGAAAVETEHSVTDSGRPRRTLSHGRPMAGDRLVIGLAVSAFRSH
jgi:hypothetical protein